MFRTLISKNEFVVITFKSCIHFSFRSLTIFVSIYVLCKSYFQSKRKQIMGFVILTNTGDIFAKEYLTFSFNLSILANE